MKKLYKRLVVVGVGASALGVSMAQEAEGPDFGGLTTSAIDTINGLTPVIMTVGGAIIALAAVAMGIRWVKATFF